MPLKKDRLSLLLPYTPTHIPTYIYPCTHTPIYVSMYLDIHLYIWMDVYREIGALQAGPGGEMPLKKDRLSLLLPYTPTHLHTYIYPCIHPPICHIYIYIYTYAIYLSIYIYTSTYVIIYIYSIQTYTSMHPHPSIHPSIHPPVCRDIQIHTCT